MGALPINSKAKSKTVSIPLFFQLNNITETLTLTSFFRVLKYLGRLEDFLKTKSARLPIRKCLVHRTIIFVFCGFDNPYTNYLYLGLMIIRYGPADFLARQVARLAVGMFSVLRTIIFVSYGFDYPYTNCYY
jgi:hypothetical protein